MPAPHTTHFAIVLYILRHINDILFHVLYYSTHSFLEMSAHFDDNWVDDPTDHHSIIGYCFFFSDSLIS